MLAITIRNARQTTRLSHGSGPLLLGREPDAQRPHVVVRDEDVMPMHLRLEALSGATVRVANLSGVDIPLSGGAKVRPGATAEMPLPLSLRIGSSEVEIDAELAQEPSSAHGISDAGGHRFETVSAPALQRLPTTGRTTLAGLGRAPPVEKLAEWFETLLSVQRSAVGSSGFYLETARALVDLVGLDRGLVLLRENEGWKVVAGYTADEARGLHFSRSIVSLVAKQGRTYYGNPQELSITSSLANVEALVASPVLDERGDVVGILYGSRDFTSAGWGAGIEPLEAQVVQLLATTVSAGLIRLRMEERLRQVEQLAAVGQAIGYIIHDLRGPLGNVQQLLEMVRNDTPTTFSRDEQFEFIEASLGICRELLSDTLEFCRGRVHVNPVRGTFLELFQKHLRLLGMDLDALGVALQIDVPDGLLMILDPDRMARVLRNLAKNAAEACRGRQGACVTIGARALPDTVELWVEDNGPGLPPEVQRRLFQPFSTHGKRGGTGFGLAIAKQLVEAHEGRISVVSGEGGARFTIALPARTNVPENAAVESSETPALASAPRAADSAKPRSCRVLLAEDGLVNQRIIAGLLAQMDHVVVVARDGKDAVAAWESQPFDIVLMDLEMPVMDGREATRAIRQRERRHGRHTPIVALTAHDSPESNSACLALGMDAVLAKPVRAQDLTAIIDKLITLPHGAQ